MLSDFEICNDLFGISGLISLPELSVASGPSFQSVPQPASPSGRKPAVNLKYGI